jgi:deoxyadenosine/deoxycytidine kinase
LSDTLPYRYITVDGPIGAGKTTLVDRLTERFEGVKVLEDIENPFLADFYKDAPGAAFQTELYFLLSRFKQQQELVQPELFQRLVISDYAFQKNRIFAYINLSDDELMLFEKLFLLLEPQVPKPDLVLFLTADVGTCMERIRRRSMKAERTISDGYVGELIDAYNHYYYHYDQSPLLVVDTRHLDFAHSDADLDQLIQQLQRSIRATEYYVPMGSAAGGSR